MKELLIIFLIIVAGTQLVRAYNAYEEPNATREMRVAGVLDIERH